MEAPNEEAGEESGKEIGIRARGRRGGGGIDIGVPGSDGDGTKGGRGGRRSTKGWLGAAEGAAETHIR